MDGNRIMALAGVEGAVGRDIVDLLLGRDLIEPFWQHRRIAGGELYGAYFLGFLINPDVDLAPNPAVGDATLAGVPLTFPLDLGACVVDQEVHGAIRAMIGDLHLQRLLASRQRAEVRHCPIYADQVQQALDNTSRLAEPIPNSTFIVRRA